MIEHLQMAQRARIQDIERSVEQRRRVAHAAKPTRRVARLRHLIASLL